MSTASELRAIAKEMNIRGYSKMNKSQLTAAIEGTVPDIGGHSVPEQVEQEQVEQVEKPKAKRAPSKWVRFCQEHSKAEGITYKQAMSEKDAYKEWQTKQDVPKEEKLESVGELQEE